MARLLDDMGRPQAKLKAVHVAGSKGKGSVAAMLSSILHHSGYKTGTYTSPHIAHLRERIAVGGEPISEGCFEGLVRGNEALLMEANRREGGRLSYFEALTALALCHFAQQQAGGLPATVPHGWHGIAPVEANGGRLCSTINHLSWISCKIGKRQSQVTVKGGVIISTRPKGGHHH